MDAPPVNVLVTTFPGLSLPRTLCLSLPSTSTTHDLFAHLDSRLPHFPQTRLTLVTTSNTHITPIAQPLYHLLPPKCTLLPLHLTAPLPGGKGGFGSQLRAAGGRMSSRKKKENAALATGSARNLDGRRLRTVAEAKNLAAYLATKPDADAKEREEKRKRWEGIVEMAEAREAEMRAGKGRDGRRRGVGEEWLEVKEEVSEGVRRAVGLGMRDEEGSEGGSGGSEGVSASEDEGGEGEVMELDEEEMERLRIEAEGGDEDAIWVLKERLRIPERYLPKPAKRKAVQRRFAGFDDDDEDLSSSEEATEDVDEVVDEKGKGKAKAG